MSSIDTSPSSRLPARLTREWQALAARPAVLRRAQAWDLPVAFGSLDELVAAAGFWPTRDDRLAAAAAPDRHPHDRGAHDCHPHDDGARGDEVLAELLVVARTDDLAARVVLQRLLPGLMARSRRWGATRAGGSPCAFDELVASGWQVVRTFRVESSSRHLAARLLRAAEHLAFVKPNRRLGRFEPVEPRLLDMPVEHPADPDPLDELIEVLGTARRALTERDLVMVRLLVGGRSMLEVARELDVSVRTVTNHRNALVQRVRSAVLAA